MPPAIQIAQKRRDGGKETDLARSEEFKGPDSLVEFGGTDVLHQSSVASLFRERHHMMRRLTLGSEEQTLSLPGWTETSWDRQLPGTSTSRDFDRFEGCVSCHFRRVSGQCE
jgi:hypothetical protein